MTDQEEAYLSLLCLRNSTFRIAQLYWTYIKLRSLTGQAPPILIIMLSVLWEKQQGLHNRLVAAYPEDMAAEKWHGQDEMNDRLGDMSRETQEDLQKICQTEMQMLQLVGMMMKQ
ncbi:hypothetical protein [Endozoicomonas sp. 8E]|uniref:hypothetical protein n=1 Tax=Endozoicomonas sp. 8E TaxID=3035692 RepID=UPI0029391866|nr:hypothetical protein [Endozoicomonas sp. 8E]WOG27758.1 hypothetical protein P6910_24960 [Endozoicomonas sp. 8E]